MPAVAGNDDRAFGHTFDHVTDAHALGPCHRLHFGGDVSFPCFKNLGHRTPRICFILLQPSFPQKRESSGFVSKLNFKNRFPIGAFGNDKKTPSIVLRADLLDNLFRRFLYVFRGKDRRDHRNAVRPGLKTSWIFSVLIPPRPKTGIRTFFFISESASVPTGAP